MRLIAQAGILINKRWVFAQLNNNISMLNQKPVQKSHCVVCKWKKWIISLYFLEDDNEHAVTSLLFRKIYPVFASKAWIE